MCGKNTTLYKISWNMMMMVMKCNSMSLIRKHSQKRCELRGRTGRITSDDRRARDLSSAESQMPRALHENSNFLTPKVKLPTIEIPKFGGQIQSSFS